MTEILRVPSHEPEVLEAAARRRGQDGRNATTALSSVAVLGVQVASRSRQAEELKLIAAIIQSMPAELRSVITKAWCDSEAPAAYTLTLWRCPDDVARSVAEWFEKGCVELAGGHNGIHVERAGGRGFALDPA
jgi:hypothetical protein